MKKSGLNNYMLAHKLLDSIIATTAGSKVLTVLGPKDGSIMISINDSGKVGVEATHRLTVLSRIADAIEAEGKVIVQQCLKLGERRIESGRKRYIPQQNIYGFTLGNGKVTPWTKEEIESFSSREKELCLTLKEASRICSVG